MAILRISNGVVMTTIACSRSKKRYKKKKFKKNNQNGTSSFSCYDALRF